MIHALFWLSVAGLFYIYAGYPLWMLMRMRIATRAIKKSPCPVSVSVLISVHGEAAQLERKLKSLLDAEGADRIREILVGSDGSPDDVRGAVERVGDPRIHLLAFPVRRGKPSVLNDLMARATGDVVVFTDARQPIARGALGALLENFADPEVGVVSGELVFMEGESRNPAAHGIGAYWRYEKAIRKAESAVGSVPGATGALYAVRRSLLDPIPPQTILDDVAIPLNAIRQGARCVFEGRAEVYDAPSADARREAIRKRRTIAGNVQLILLWPGLLLPWRNPVWFEFVSHKLARLASPLLLLVLLYSTVWLRGERLYGTILLAQGAFGFLALLGWLLGRVGVRVGALGIPMMFIALNLSTLAALYDAISGRFVVQWRRPT
ncbi:MAG TPA: glycosyltransferase [Kiritimatiellia bacterium]|nr:glycosyltransferase [Kiritimatiellia bacterium]